MSFLITFIVLSVINVIFSTVRSIVTIKGGKMLASLISGGYFAFYNIVLIYTVADFDMLQKCIITFATNVIGVWIVKFIEDKMRKNEIYKVEATVKKVYFAKMVDCLEAFNISYSFIDIDKYYIFNIYCDTSKQVKLLKDILKDCKAKYFVDGGKSMI